MTIKKSFPFLLPSSLLSHALFVTLLYVSEYYSPFTQYFFYNKNWRVAFLLEGGIGKKNNTRHLQLKKKRDGIKGDSFMFLFLFLFSYNIPVNKYAFIANQITTFFQFVTASMPITATIAEFRFITIILFHKKKIYNR